MVEPTNHRKSIYLIERLAPGRERKIVLLLCAIAAIRVFIFSAAFPFFNNVDEQQHVDLVMKYARGDWPRDLEYFSPESAYYFSLYETPEYFIAPQQFKTGNLPAPRWTWPAAERDDYVEKNTAWWQTQKNHESGEPPLYYAVAGAWLDLGRAFAIKGGWLLYWIRVLNVFFAAALVWVGFIAAKLVFPERQFIRLSVPLFLAIWPQSAFYSIQSDVLSPLCFGIAFAGLIRLLDVDVPGLWLAIGVGLALAVTCLAKTANIPLLTVGALAVIFKVRQLVSTGRLGAALPSLTALALSICLPIILWFAWNLHTFGDFTLHAQRLSSSDGLANRSATGYRTRFLPFLD